MYKKLIHVIILFVIAFPAKAQLFEAGVSGGLNAAWMSNISHKGYQVYQFQGGIFSQKKLNQQNTYLRLEFRYSPEGNHNFRETKEQCCKRQYLLYFLNSRPTIAIRLSG